MKRGALNSIAESLCRYLCSRNNDIAGYWGVGVLCVVAKREYRSRFSFKIVPGNAIRIGSCDLSDSNRVTDKLVKLGIDSIEVRLSFIEAGHYPDGAARYNCGIAVAVTQGGRTGMSICHTECWPHDSSRESQRKPCKASPFSTPAPEMRRN